MVLFTHLFLLMTIVLFIVHLNCLSLNLLRILILYILNSCLVMLNFDDNMCVVTLARDVTNVNCTFGTLYFDGFKFRTLEPVKPIIPQGNYLLTFTFSPRFSSKQPYSKFNGVPLVNGVKGHEGIRIHVGNYKSDTQGCILVGTHCDDTMIFESRKAYRDLMDRVEQRMYYNKNTFYVLEVI